MTKDEFKRLRVGDLVRITQHGKNHGKTGIVKEIIRRWDNWEIAPSAYQGGRAVIEPFNCEFESSRQIGKKRINKDGVVTWAHQSFKYVVYRSSKDFHVAVMFGEEGVSWPTTNFNTKELDVIERFLKELNLRVEGRTIDCIAILDED